MSFLAERKNIVPKVADMIIEMKIKSTKNVAKTATLFLCLEIANRDFVTKNVRLILFKTNRN